MSRDSLALTNYENSKIMFLSSGGTSTVDLVCVLCVCVVFVLSFRSKFLVTKPLPQQIYYPCCLFMLWSGIPAAISVDSVSVKEDDWTVITRTRSKLHRPQTYIQKLQTTSGTFHNRVVSEFFKYTTLQQQTPFVQDNGVLILISSLTCYILISKNSSLTKSSPSWRHPPSPSIIPWDTDMKWFISGKHSNFVVAATDLRVGFIFATQPSVIIDLLISVNPIML